VTAPKPWQVFGAGEPVAVSAGFTDPGANDTHTCAWGWDDGTADSQPAGTRCDRIHTFPTAGMYTTAITVTVDLRNLEIGGIGPMRSLVAVQHRGDPA